MTNFEFYKEKITEIAGAGSGVALVRDEPVSCDSIHDCNDCELFSIGGDCSAGLIKWLYAEHKEQPKINLRTKAMFEAIRTGWVARDEYGMLFLYAKKPVKGEMCWMGNGIDNGSSLKTPVYPFLTLDFIKWEDEEPWSVEDICKLEVV